MKKAPDAFRTISEVADLLETPAHVLRFWESKFYQVRPVKRAGGRRYYRPDDVALINGIRHLLQVQGMTIRGVQRVLQENGAKHVVGLGSPLPLSNQQDVIDAEPQASVPSEQAQPRDSDAGTGAEPHVFDAAPVVQPEPSQIEASDRLDTGDTEVVADIAADTEVPEPAAEAPNLTATPTAEVLAPIAEVSKVATEHDDADRDQQDAAQPSVADSDEDTMTDDNLAPPEVLPTSDTTMDAILEKPIPRDPVAVPAAEPAADDLFLAIDKMRVAKTLRSMPRGALGDRRDPVDRLSRRIDAMLDRMSEASGAGRW